MDIKNGADFRTARYQAHNNIEQYHKYDYARNGILIRCLPKVMFHGNSLLVPFLQMIDMKFIMLFKYIDRVKNFKNIYIY